MSRPPHDHDHDHDHAHGAGQGHVHDHGAGHDHGFGHDHGHAHGFGHVHVHAPRGMDPRKALGWSLGLNTAFLGVEVVVGLMTGSLALLSDAAHMVSDVSALALALGAAELARRRVARGMTYGLARAEVLGAFVNAVLLIGACVYIVVEAIGRVAEGPPPVPGLPVLVVGGLGLAINLGSAWVLHRSDAENLNIRGALLHMLADALGSAAAMVAAGLLMLGYPLADPITSLVVAALVAVGAVRLLRDAGRILLELPPPGFDVARVRDALGAIDGVTDVHDLHVWSIDGRESLVSAHLVIADSVGIEAMSDRALHLLGEEFGVHHATVQVERGGQCATRCDAEPCGG